MLGYQLGGIATQADIAAGFNNSAVLGRLNELTLGQATGFANLNSTICSQQYDTARMLNDMNITNLQSANALQAQLAECCCKTQRAIDGVNYNMATNTCALQNAINTSARDIIQSQQWGTQKILDYLSSKENQSLRDENFALRLSASQERQNAYLVDQLGAKQPIPAYPVFPATSFAYPTGITFGVGGGNSCGGCGYGGGYGF